MRISFPFRLFSAALMIAASSLAYAQTEQTPIELETLAPALPAPDGNSTLIQPVLAPVAEEKPTEITPEEQLPPEALEPVTPEWTGSLMFDDQKAENLMAIYRAYLIAQRQAVSPDAGEGALDVEALLKTAETVDGEQIPEEVLKLSLNSIVYENANDWSIWVNGTRYSREAAMQGFMVDKSAIKVLKADDKHVTYLWTPIPASYSRVQGRWLEKQRLGDLVKSPNVAYNQQVVFDEKAKTVTITMRPNQTFASEFMSVLEGGGTIRQPMAIPTTAIAVPEETPATPVELPLQNADILRDPESQIAPVPQEARENPEASAEQKEENPEIFSEPQPDDEEMRDN